MFYNTIGISSGISDFHKLVATSFKMACPKNKPIEKVYRYQTRARYRIAENTYGAISEKKLTMKIPRVLKVHKVLRAFLTLDRNFGTLCLKCEEIKCSRIVSKSKLKELTVTECPCSICMTYIEGLGYFNHIIHTDT